MAEGTAAAARQALLAQASAQFHGMAQELGHWVSGSPGTLAEIAQHTLALVQDVGCQGAAAGVAPPPTIRCACGQPAA